MSNLAAQGSLYSWSSFQGVSSTMGQGSIPLHELGHTLGLLHTFRGMEPLILFPQIPPCALAVQDTCIDGVQYNHTTTAAGSGTRGLLTGDLVDDTPVSPLFVPLEGGACGQQPTGSDCAAVPWAGVPTRNFMGQWKRTHIWGAGLLFWCASPRGRTCDVRLRLMHRLF
jgi:hypothetical protein